MNKEIKTPWGKIIPEVSLFPIYYLLFIYCFVYILPYGKLLVGVSWFDWFRSEDGPLEWIQFIEYALSCFLAFFIFFNQKKKKGINAIIWLILSFLCFLIAGEEISWGERLTGLGIDRISNLNVQGETNFHNLPFFHNYLLDPVFEVSCIFLGWFGWRRFKTIRAFPQRIFLYIFYLWLCFIFILIFLGHQQLNKLEMIKRFLNFYCPPVYLYIVTRTFLKQLERIKLVQNKNLSNYNK